MSRYTPVNRLTGESGPEFDFESLAALWIMLQPEEGFGWRIAQVRAGASAGHAVTS